MKSSLERNGGATKSLHTAQGNETITRTPRGSLTATHHDGSEGEGQVMPTAVKSITQTNKNLKRILRVL